MTRILIAHDPVNVQINVVHPDAIFPTYGTEGSAGFDLASVEDIRLFRGEAKAFRTGLIVKAPKDHMLLVTERSSTWKKWGVHLGNIVGIVDEDYCGPQDELLLYVWAPNQDAPNGNVTRIIPAGTRIAQGIFVPITRAEFQVVDGDLAASRGGWGSTGTAEFKRHAE